MRGCLDDGWTGRQILEGVDDRQVDGVDGWTGWLVERQKDEW